MYKYTYLLSQSYRSEATVTNESQGLGVGCGRGKGLENVEVGLKNMTRNVVQRKDYAGGIVDRNGEYKTAERQYGKVGHNKETKSKENAGIDARKDKSIIMLRENSEMKVKSIAEKYSHHQPLNEKPIDSKQFHSNPQNGQDNKAYREYKEHKVAIKENRAITQYQTIINHKPRESHPDYSPINEIKIERQPLREANGKSTQDQQVNRTRVRSQITSHLQKQKTESHNLILPNKKYTYNISEKQTKQIPVTAPKQTPVPTNHRQAQSSQTVAKLSSLQQRIKSTIGSYLPA